MHFFQNFTKFSLIFKIFRSKSWQYICTEIVTEDTATNKACCRTALAPFFILKVANGSVCCVTEKQLSLSLSHSDFKIRRYVYRWPRFMFIDAVLSFWRFEAEVLQQSNKEEKHLLTSKLFTETRTFSYNSCQFHIIVSFIMANVMIEKMRVYR